MTVGILLVHEGEDVNAYILMSTFVALNLFIAVVVNAMHENEPSAAELQTQAELNAVRQELAALNAKLDQLLLRDQPS
ncbi:hypothetical protein AB0L44_42010 [Nonomuraea wenchangensis]|uniref:hypothetical protein n=1 Tax=Nonomuraea wenchangensis TaxID=568860 RepID=UPI00343AD10B